MDICGNFKEIRLQVTYVIYAIVLHLEYMFWNCPVLSQFWNHVNPVLSDLLEISYVPYPGFWFFYDNVDVTLMQIQYKIKENYN